VTYDKVWYLLKSPEEHVHMHNEWQHNSTVINEIWNPINNPIKSTPGVTALWSGRRSRFSSKGTTVTLTTKDCVIHVFVFMFGQANFENTGWCTTRSLWIVCVLTQRNLNLGGGGGSTVTCVVNVEFLSPVFRLFTHSTYVKKKRS
jgi:hypothetical protein